ncbi:hypothetical protein RRF57_006008 [Xylaria bambusicola]|uniref:Uncharacterized protein n=1 Tax=Xylaria bambusicola TaxID=326684 RepID=A0AAN7Z8I2_9PEZI
MADETYDLCLPILQNPNIKDEDKTDKPEDLLKREICRSSSITDSIEKNVIGCGDNRSALSYFRIWRCYVDGLSDGSIAHLLSSTLVVPER